MNMHHDERFPPTLAGEPDADELETVWSHLDAAYEPAEESAADRTDAAWDRLSRTLGLAETHPASDTDATSRQATPSLAFTRMSWLRVAAAVVVLLGGVSVWHQLPVTHRSPAGERVAVTLPDGSEVELNAGSTLRHRRGFQVLPGVARGARSVRLEGEAFFDVAPGERAFEVMAGAARVTVLGTRFNVRARTGDAARIDVEEGRVRVEARASRASVDLAAGEAVRVEGGAPTLSSESVSADRIAPWRTGGLTVSEEPLVDVVAEIALRFGASISLAPSVDGSVRMTAYYPLLTGVETVLSDLATQQNLQVRRTSEGWELF